MRASNLLLSVAAALLPVTTLAVCPDGLNKTLVTFDKLPVGKPVPNGYPAARPSNWTAFEVVKKSDYGLKGGSGANGVKITDINGFLNFYTDSQQLVDLSSFYFGAYFEEGDAPARIPGDASIAVVQTSDLYTHDYSVPYGPFNYTAAKPDKNGLVPLVKVDFASNNNPHGRIEFATWRVPTTGAYILDSIEICWLDGF